MSKGNTARAAFAWALFQRFSTQIVGFLVTIILARYISAEEYGLFAIISVFIALSQTLYDSGLSTSLIQKKKVESIDYNTVFAFNMVLSGLLYFALFISADYISRFFEDERLTLLIRVCCLVIILNSFSIVGNARLTRLMNFDLLAKARLISSSIAGVVAVVMAISNFGIWSIVFQQITSSILYTCILIMVTNYMPKFRFDWNSFQSLFSFGYKLVLTGLLSRLSQSITTFSIGRFFGTSSLGHYNRANVLTSYGSDIITNVTQSVSFPLLSKYQSETSTSHDLHIKSVRLATIVATPLLLLLFVFAEPLILIVLGERWQDSIFFVKVIALAKITYPTSVLNRSLLNSMGRSDLSLKTAIQETGIFILILTVCLPYSIDILIYGFCLHSILSYFINSQYLYYSIKMSIKRQILDLKEIFIVSFVSIIPVELLVIKSPW